MQRGRPSTGTFVSSGIGGNFTHMGKRARYVTAPRHCGGRVRRPAKFCDGDGGGNGGAAAAGGTAGGRRSQAEDKRKKSIASPQHDTASMSDTGHAAITAPEQTASTDSKPPRTRGTGSASRPASAPPAVLSIGQVQVQVRFRGEANFWRRRTRRAGAGGSRAKAPIGVSFLFGNARTVYAEPARRTRGDTSRVTRRT